MGVHACINITFCTLIILRFFLNYRGIFTHVHFACICTNNINKE